jgi:hypothetical protein
MYSYVFGKEGIFLTSNISAVKPDLIKSEFILKLDADIGEKWNNLDSTYPKFEYYKIANDSIVTINNKKIKCFTVAQSKITEFGIDEKNVFYISMDLKLVKHLIYRNKTLFSTYELVNFQKIQEPIISSDLIIPKLSTISSIDSLKIEIFFDSVIKTFYIGGDYFIPIREVSKNQFNFTIEKKEKYEIWIFGFDKNGELVDLIKVN